MIEKIKEDVTQWLNDKSDIAEHKSNWASGLADPCLRRMTYYRTHWQMQTKPEPFLQGIFETGNAIELQTIADLNEVGRLARPRWMLIKGALKYNDSLFKDYQIGARPDVALLYDDKLVGVVEIKSMNPNTFRQVYDLDSLNKYRWTRGYRAQLTMYLLGANQETGWLLLVNKSNHYDVKWIKVTLDYEYAESLLGKCKIVNEAVANGIEPEKINDPDECPNCCFNSVCCPEYSTGGNLEVVDNTELEFTMEEIARLKPAADEYKDYEKQRDVLLVKGNDVVCGRFMVLWKKIKATRKPSTGGEYEFYRKKIIVSD